MSHCNRRLFRLSARPMSRQLALASMIAIAASAACALMAPGMASANGHHPWRAMAHYAPVILR